MSIYSDRMLISQWVKMMSKRLTEDVITFKDQQIFGFWFIRKEEKKTQGRILKGSLMFYRIIMAMGTKRNTTGKNVAKI